MDYGSYPMMGGIYQDVPQAMSGPVPVQTMEQEYKEKKRKSSMYTEEIEELSHAVYIYWKAKEMVKTKEFDVDDANEKAEQMWADENEDVRETFRRAAVVQDIMLGNAMGKKRRQGKSEYAQNRAEYNPFLLYCRDHRENVREKGSRGKGMSTLSAMWKDLPESEKERYQEQAKANKAKDSVKGETQPEQGTNVSSGINAQ
ncbi:HMG box domain-containing protein [Entamoeba marina]